MSSCRRAKKKVESESGLKRATSFEKKEQQKQKPSRKRMENRKKGKGKSFKRAAYLLTKKKLKSDKNNMLLTMGRHMHHLAIAADKFGLKNMRSGFSTRLAPLSQRISQKR